MGLCLWGVGSVMGGVELGWFCSRLVVVVRVVLVCYGRVGMRSYVMM